MLTTNVVVKGDIISYVALGSSSTAGAGASRPEHGYVALLADALAEVGTKVAVTNLGGRNLASILEDWDDVIASEPEMVTVLAFSDYAKTPIGPFFEQLRLLFTKANEYAAERKKAGRSFRLFFGDLRVDPIYVAGISEPDTGPLYSPSVFTLIAAKNDAAARASDDCDAITLVPVVDQNAIHPEWIGPEGHPNDLGHGYLAGCFRTAVEPWLSRTTLGV